ncbi:MAG: HAD family hydrolase [Thermodesulfobacteriota bacterium]
MKRDPLQKIRAVIFDFDGTLAVLNIDFATMRQQVYEWMKGFGIKSTSLKETYLLEIIDEAYTLIWERSPMEAETFYERAHHILYQVEMNAAKEGRLIPGVKEVLNQLRMKGIKVGIITRNCEEAVRKVFPDIDAYCDVFISRDSVKKVKPHPDHLNAATKVLGVAGKEAFMVGDHSIDILAGKRVGMKTIGVLTGRTTREEFENVGADYILRNANEVLELTKGKKSEKPIKGGMAK